MNNVTAAVGLVLNRWREKNALRPRKRNEERLADAEVREETNNKEEVIEATEEKAARLVKSGVGFPDISEETGLPLPEIYKIFKKMK